MILRRNGIIALFIGLLLFSLWLGVMTHYALTSVEQRRNSNTVNSGGAGKATVSNPQSDATQAAPADVASPRPSQSPLSAALEEMQSSLLRRRIKELESDATRSSKELEELREKLAACEKRRTTNYETPNDLPPPPTTTNAPPAYISNLDLYQQEQQRIKEDMRKQRQRVLEDRYRQQKAGAAVAAKSTGGGYGITPLQEQQQQQEPSGMYMAPGDKGLSRTHLNSLHRYAEEEGQEVIAVVVIAYQRAQQLQLCLDNILRRMPHRNFRLYASQDSEDFPDVSALLQQYERRGSLVRMVHQRNTSGGTEEEYQNGWESYLAISHHVQFVFNQLFQSTLYDRVILIEEDIEVGVDFFEYMKAMSPLLDQDPSLYCVSAWNDNGKADRIADPKAVYRTDFFPGLGWMLSRKLWAELGPRWPPGFWDDWLRQPRNRKGRSCLRPEVPRSFTWCTEEGVSQGQFCAEHLASIKLADTSVNWASIDTSYLLKNRYDDWIDSLLSRAKLVRSADELLTLPVANGGRHGPAGDGSEATDVKLVYHTNEEFQVFAMQLNLMEDFKDNVPRTAYRGIVTFRHLHYRVHLIPELPLYD